MAVRRRSALCTSKSCDVSSELSQLAGGAPERSARTIAIAIAIAAALTRVTKLSAAT
jgi:hypothetical protein